MSKANQQHMHEQLGFDFGTGPRAQLPAREGRGPAPTCRSPTSGHGDSSCTSRGARGGRLHAYHLIASARALHFSKSVSRTITIEAGHRLRLSPAAAQHLPKPVLQLIRFPLSLDECQSHRLSPHKADVAQVPGRTG